MPSVTIEHIAELAGVSQSTVSRVLNGHPNIRPEVRARVWRVIEERGYVPRAAARALANQRSNVIAFLIPRSTDFLFSDPFFALAIQGVTEVCMGAGYFLTLLMLGNGEDALPLDHLLRGGHFDGVVTQAAKVDDPVLPQLLKAGIPLVQIGRHPYFADLSWVDAENREGAREAVLHLVGLGHRRIATITGPLEETAATDRRDGYKQALLEAGIAIEPGLIVEGDWSHGSGYRGLNHVMSLAQPPTALFAASDRMAIGALHGAHLRGLCVPDDLAVVGFDDVPDASFAAPPLTTMRSPIRGLGAAAAEMLIALIEGNPPGRQQRALPNTLVVRESCGAAGRPSSAEQSSRMDARDPLRAVGAQLP